MADALEGELPTDLPRSRKESRQLTGDLGGPLYEPPRLLGSGLGVRGSRKLCEALRPLSMDLGDRGEPLPVPGRVGLVGDRPTSRKVLREVMGDLGGPL